MKALLFRARKHARESSCDSKCCRWSLPTNPVSIFAVALFDWMEAMVRFVGLLPVGGQILAAVEFVVDRL